MLLLVHTPLAYSQELAKQSNFEIEKIGGGELYPNKIYRRDATTIVFDKKGLIKALNGAQSFDVIYVDDSARINLSEIWDLPIKENVTLASGRGNNGSLGALLYTSTKEKNKLLQLKTGARVTGLRLEGPSIVIDGPGMCYNDAQGILISDTQNVEVDNNEIYAWPTAGVEVLGSKNIKIHHNHFHHHLRIERSNNCGHYALGYGVVADTSQNVIIERNLFDHNRHDIASSGSITDDTEYLARYNLVLGGAVGHNFDVHGGGDRSSREDYNAGSYFEIEHNILTQKNHYGVAIRGIPLIKASIINNEFPHRNESSAIIQKKCSKNEMHQCDFYKNMVAYDNKFNVSYPKRWFVSFSGETFWRFRKFEPSHPKHVGWGDFNGDGKQDAFRTTGGLWQVSLSGRENWKKWNVSNVTLNNIRFADFNGDGKTDVFTVFSGGQWNVSFSGSSKWQKIGSSRTPIQKLTFGDFNGDGKTDIFRTHGKWEVSYSGNSNWVKLDGSKIKLPNLAFGDFNGDGKTDVFNIHKEQWRVAYGGTGKWQKLGTSKVPLKELAFGDFDGDGKTDIFRANGKRWYVSFGGKSSWQPLNRSSIKLKDLVLADVNGDGKADAISHQGW